MNLVSSKVFKPVVSIAAVTACSFSGVMATTPQAEAASALVQVNCQKPHDLSVSVDPQKNRWSRYCFKGTGSISINLKGATGYISTKKGHMWVSRTSSGWRKYSINPQCVFLKPSLNISSISLY